MWHFKGLMMLEQAWIIIGYLTRKPKKPYRIDKLYFGKVIGKSEAFTVAQNIFWNHSITDVVESQWTRWDRLKEVLRDLRWLWIPALLVIGSLILMFRFHLVTLSLIILIVGFCYGVAHAPHSPV